MPVEKRTIGGPRRAAAVQAVLVEGAVGVHVPEEQAVPQGLTLVHVRAQLEQLKDTFRLKLGYTVDRRAQVELKSKRV
jgi:hypothetical protein